MYLFHIWFTQFKYSFFRTIRRMFYYGTNTCNGSFICRIRSSENCCCGYLITFLLCRKTISTTVGIRWTTSSYSTMDRNCFRRCNCCTSIYRYRRKQCKNEKLQRKQFFGENTCYHRSMYWKNYRYGH